MALPAPEDLPDDTLAVIDEVPGGHGKITMAEFRHGLELTAVQKGRRALPRPGTGGYGKLAHATLDFMLEGAWIYGQATEWSISVTPGQISRTVAQIKRESFKNGTEYRRFLHETHYTRHDVYERVEIQLLSTRLQSRLRRELGKGVTRKSEQRAFEEFVKEFTERWRARTVCAPRYATERCSNGPPPPR